MSKHIEQPKCKSCGKLLIGKNAIEVGYCVPCYHAMMADDEDDEPIIVPEWIKDHNEDPRNH